MKGFMEMVAVGAMVAVMVTVLAWIAIQKFDVEFPDKKYELYKECEK